MLILVAFPWPLSFLSNSDVFSNGDTEIQRTKREKGTEVWREKFQGEKRMEQNIYIYIYILELCYSIILKLELYYSTIAKKFAIVGFTVF